MNQPFPQTSDKAGKAWQGQTFQLIAKIYEMQP
jgi:hypothetical protein